MEHLNKSIFKDLFSMSFDIDQETIAERNTQILRVGKFEI